jgi:endoglucanase
MKYILLLLAAGIVLTSHYQRQENAGTFIRVNLLGYKPAGTKVAVWGSMDVQTIAKFQLVDVLTGKIVFEGPAGKPFGNYGPFRQTYRLDFSAFNTNGKYLLQAGEGVSPEFTISEDVYRGAADFCLRYMRQQRSGFNPYLKDSCHTNDGYTMYGPMPDSTHIDVSGGWHDASDYLQYVTTSANATYHLLAAYRDFPSVFMDRHQANGLTGWNGKADVLDEAKWGLDWLLKMHPKEDWMFNQLADDRDHSGMRIPKEDSFYGKGFERPVYFCTGKPQGLFKYKNRSTGVASTAGKFSSAFGLGFSMFKRIDSSYAELLYARSVSAFHFGLKDTGVCQTAPGRAPYFYEEDNWTDDMELAGAILSPLAEERSLADLDQYRKDIKSGKRKPNPNQSGPHFDGFARLVAAHTYAYSKTTPITPWLGADTAKHYQWYPFINLGHYELAKQTTGTPRKELLGYYKTGIEKVWQKAKENAFYRGVPFIWCSNNLTTSFAIQCYWYRTLSGDQSFTDLEQANFDWLFGCNPWGTSFVYGLPAWGDTPADPHSAFTHLKKYPIDGGLVDGPVYGSIYKKLIGITLYEPDEYAPFQSDLVVYHDDYGDYSTNEPTMDGTASLIYLLAAKEAEKLKQVKKKP